MARMLYNLPGDNIISSATMTSSGGGGPLAAFPLANQRDLSPANALKFTTNGATDLIYDFGSAVQVFLPVLLNHNIPAATVVTIMGNATNSWGAPTFSQTITIGAADADGYRPNSYRNLTGLPAHAAFRWWNIRVADFGAALIVGEVWLGNVIRNLTHNFSWGFTRRDRFPGKTSFRTPGGVNWSYVGLGRQRELEAECQTSDAGLVSLVSFCRLCGGANGRPAIVVPETPDGLDVWLAHWTVDPEYLGNFAQDNMKRLGFLEAARGPAS